MLNLLFLSMTCGVAAPASEEFHIPPNILKVGASSGLATYEGGTALTTDPIEAEALTKVLRDLLAKNLPDPVTKSNHNWGQQKAVTTNVRHRDGMKPWTEQVEEMRNDGTWRRSEVRLPDRDKIALAVTELSHPEEGKMLVTVGVVAERVELMFEQQIWRKGLRLYSGETRGHCKGGLVLKAEITTKAEPKPGSLLPNIVLKVHVISAELYYDKLVVDHTAGLGGEAAKALGEFTIGIIKAVKPHLEKDLLEKAQASIVKAAQKNELTLTLDKLMAAKPKAIPKKP